MDYLNKVKEFHQAFNHGALAKPGIPDETRCQLRIKLIEEELNELKLAIAHKDLVQIADALCDIQYVLSGTVLEFGLANKFAELFDAVHADNMSKRFNTYEDAAKAGEWYLTNRNEQTSVAEIEGYFFLYRQSDGKILKSRESKLDLKSIIER